MNKSCDAKLAVYKLPVFFIFLELRQFHDSSQTKSPIVTYLDILYNEKRLSLVSQI